jgi:anti-sigma factor RsiW
VTDSDRSAEPVVGERHEETNDEAPVETAGASHASIRDLLSEYIDGQLAPPLSDAVRQHVDRCAPCRAYLRTLESTVELARGLPTHGLPDHARRRILDRLATTADSSSGGA